MKKNKQLLPKYTYIPLLSALIMNFVAYNCTKIISNHLTHYNLSTTIDNKIPLLTVFVIFYISAYAEWIIGFILIARENRKICYKFLSAELIAKLLCLICFLIIPTTINRPEILGNGICNFLTKIIYMFDEPVNLFPSIHCLESWMCFRGALNLKKVPKCYKWIILVISLLVFASTVFIKQHVVIDILGGILVGEIGVFLATKFNAGIIFEKIEQRHLKKNEVTV